MNPTPSETGATEFLAYLTVGQVALAALIFTLGRFILLKMAGKPKGANDPGAAYRTIAEVFESLILSGVLVFLVIRPFFLQAFFIPSESMENTLLGDSTHHDRIWVNKLVYRYSNPHHGDIVVFLAPARADVQDISNGKPGEQKVFIKRCIGVPGDTIQVKQIGDADYVFRNGKQLMEYNNPHWPYSIKEPMDPQLNQQFAFAYPDPLKLGPNQYFMMGDNRNDSEDSRYWGPLSRRRVMGKAEAIFWPIDRIRLLH